MPLSEPAGSANRRTGRAPSGGTGGREVVETGGWVLLLGGHPGGSSVIGAMGPPGAAPAESTPTTSRVIEPAANSARHLLVCGGMPVLGLPTG